MGNLKEKIQKAKERSRSYQDNKIKNIHNRKANTSNILLFFNHKVIQTYNMIPCHSKDTIKRLGGFLRFLKNNGFTDKEIFEWLDSVITNWSQYALTKTTTDKGKEYTINSYPNLNDIIYCKNFFLNFDKIEELDEKEEGYWIQW